MNKKILLLTFLWLAVTITCVAQTQTDTIKAYISHTPPAIDGSDADACWASAAWYPINVLWMGPAMTPSDFTGRYKLAWDNNLLYMLVEVTDDSLSDQQSEPADRYWTDDCVEIFFDEDHSGGDHWYNHNAFAYHASIKYDAVDIDKDRSPKTFNDNLEVKIDTIAPNTYMWEFAIKVFTDDFTRNSPENSRRQLTANEIMGLTLAYCDNDGNFARDNFIGSMKMPSGKNDVNYQTADYFGTLLLIDPDMPNSIIPATEPTTLIYPNPANGCLFINNPEFVSYSLFNANGQIIGEPKTNLHGQTRIDIGHLSRGIYFISLTDNAGSTETQKIMVE
ncbi:MAG: T9SS type A sorting domain-containing protein [Bacteroidales bacterium]|nr:T9SS type A sorting domain-containing protein [Bacteroidales bacterium]